MLVLLFAQVFFLDSRPTSNIFTSADFSYFWGFSLLLCWSSGYWSCKNLFKACL